MLLDFGFAVFILATTLTDNENIDYLLLGQFGLTCLADTLGITFSVKGIEAMNIRRKKASKKFYSLFRPHTYIQLIAFVLKLIAVILLSLLSSVSWVDCL